MPTRVRLAFGDDLCIELSAGCDVVAGIGSGVDLRLEDLIGGDATRVLSRRHLRLRHRAGDGFAVCDLGSLNGTAVNGRPLAPGCWWRLQTGDVILLGIEPAYCCEVRVLEVSEAITSDAASGAPGEALALSHVKTLYVTGNGHFVLDGIDIIPSHLTPLEQKLLEYLYRNAARVCTYDELIESVWGYARYETIQNNTVAALISSLRHKLDLVSPGAGRRHVRTVRGRGVLLMPLEATGS